MTGPAQQAPVQQSMQALASTVNTSTDFAVLGVGLSNGGVNGAEVSNLIGLIERLTADAGKSVAVALLPVLTKLLEDTHKAACLEIMRQLQVANGGKWSNHDACAQVAWNVAQMRPSHVVPQVQSPR